MKSQTHTIDAANRPLGRLATEISVLLRGKNRADFAPHTDEGDIVIIKNVAKIRFTGKKFSEKVYHHHTGYLGNLKTVPLERIFKRNPAILLKKVVLGMLPKNRLKAKAIKRLKFE